MRNMSFMITTQQVENETKTVTRRLGWDRLRIGEVVMACEKCMGLKRGQQIRKLKAIRITGFRKEPLNANTPEDCVREGFPEMAPAEFVAMFCQHNGCEPDRTVNRIEFEYVKEGSN